MFVASLFLLAELFALVDAADNCADMSRPNYVCASLKGEKMEFYRNLDTKYWFCDFMKVGYKVESIEVTLRNNVYLFDVSKPGSCVSDKSVIMSAASHCKMSALFNGSVDPSIVANLTIEIGNGGKIGGVVVSHDDAWVTFDLSLPPQLRDPATLVKMRTTVHRQIPSRFKEWLLLNVNNMWAKTINHSAHDEGGGSQFWSLTLDGVAFFHMASSSVLEKEHWPDTPINRVVTYTAHSNVSYWNVSGRVPTVVSKTFHFDGADAHQCIRHRIDMHLGVWRGGYMNVLAMLIALSLLATLIFGALISVPFVLCHLHKKKLERKQQMMVGLPEKTPVATGWGSKGFDGV
eukprot:Platyproteum_vivax@DN4134_c0_g1_i1.p1